MKKQLLILMTLVPSFASSVVYGGQHSGLGGGAPPAPPPPADPAPAINRSAAASDALAEWVKAQLEALLENPDADK